VAPDAGPPPLEEAPDAGALLREVLIDERYEPGMVVLDRQATHVAADGIPAFVPETVPTPLRGGFIYLSVVALVCGTIVISALNLGATWHDGIVRIPLVVGAVPLFITMGEAALRIARSIPAWWPVNRGRALFRAVWVATIAVFAAVVVLALGIALAA